MGWGPTGSSVLVLQPDHSLFSELPTGRLWRRIGPRPCHLRNKQNRSGPQKPLVVTTRSCRKSRKKWTFTTIHYLGIGCYFSILFHHFISSVATANERMLSGMMQVYPETWAINIHEQYVQPATGHLIGNGIKSTQILLRHRRCFRPVGGIPTYPPEKYESQIGENEKCSKPPTSSDFSGSVHPFLSFWGPLAGIPCRSRRTPPTSGAWVHGEHNCSVTSVTSVRSKDTSRLPNGENQPQ